MWEKEMLNIVNCGEKMINFCGTSREMFLLLFRNCNFRNEIKLFLLVFLQFRKIDFAILCGNKGNANCLSLLFKSALRGKLNFHKVYDSDRYVYAIWLRRRRNFREVLLTCSLHRWKFMIYLKCFLRVCKTEEFLQIETKWNFQLEYNASLLPSEAHRAGRHSEAKSIKNLLSLWFMLMGFLLTNCDSINGIGKPPHDDVD